MGYAAGSPRGESAFAVVDNVCQGHLLLSPDRVWKLADKISKILEIREFWNSRWYLDGCPADGKLALRSVQVQFTSWVQSKL